MSYHYHQQLGVREIDPDTYAAWVAAGNPKADAYTPISDPPDQYAQFDGSEWVWPAGMSPDERHEAYLDGLECTDLQAELELISRELWAPVQAWIDTQEATVQAYFRRAKTWKYRDPRLQAGAAAMGMTDAQLIEILESARTV